MKVDVENMLVCSSEVSFLRSNFFLTEPHFKASENKNQTLVSESLLTSLHLHGPVGHDPSETSRPPTVPCEESRGAGRGWCGELKVEGQGAAVRFISALCCLALSVICQYENYILECIHFSGSYCFFKSLLFHMDQLRGLTFKRGLFIRNCINTIFWGACVYFIFIFQSLKGFRNI